MTRLPHSLRQRIAAFINLEAWLLIALGAVVFACRIPFAPGGLVNLPVLAALIQTAGMVFVVAGLQIMLSMLVWPQLKVGELLNATLDEGLPPGTSLSASLVLAGLMLFNGLSLIAFVLWMAGSFGAALGMP
jgi:hypothetical protein